MKEENPNHFNKNVKMSLWQRLKSLFYVSDKIEKDNPKDVEKKDEPNDTNNILDHLNGQKYSDRLWNLPPTHDRVGQGFVISLTRQPKGMMPFRGTPPHKQKKKKKDKDS